MCILVCVCVGVCVCVCVCCQKKMFKYPLHSVWDSELVEYISYTLSLSLSLKHKLIYQSIYIYIYIYIYLYVCVRVCVWGVFVDLYECVNMDVQKRDDKYICQHLDI